MSIFMVVKVLSFPESSSFNALFLGRMRMGAAYGRRHDFSGDVKVPDRSAAACSELGHLLRQIIQIPEGLSREPESARDAREIGLPGKTFRNLDDLPKQVAEFAASGGAAVWDFHVSAKVVSPTIRRAHPHPAKEKSVER